ncbi:magnesium chelatase [Natranaerobius trueperi]|uniref:Magnesium chelatase n=1 Tax=Natranaerobius trueperi TaxID=759412 RepID=A0A226BXP8_9FIRM|nr:magnesium chelatase [Natranaerobius trueperi]OWZ83803.1 magnesium chelatase [Natranaerobius trueperi]
MLNTAQGPIIHEGNSDLLKLMRISVFSTYLGIPHHIHAEGLRGTGKTTLLRSCTEFLPKIKRIRGCVYNCHPHFPHCPEHKDLPKTLIENIGTEWIPMPFLEISHGAKPGTVIGSIDLKKITDQQKPQAGILPGIIPKAHRGIIFVDEINRLADTSPELTDILLDVMGTKPGKVQIEETGLSKVELPVNLSIWAASNPDEDPGSLKTVRRQLSDRFDFTVDVYRPTESKIVEKIIEDEREKELAIESLIDTKTLSPHQYDETGESYEQLLSLPEDIKQLLASIYIDYNIESIRAVKAIKFGSVFHAKLTNKDTINLEDVLQVVEHALKHRVSDETRKDVINMLSEVNEGNRDKTFESDRNQMDTRKTINNEMISKNRSKQIFKELFSKIRQKLNKPTKDKVVTTKKPARSLEELSQTEDNDIIKEGENEK